MRRPDWDQLRRDAGAELRPDEELLLLSPAIRPPDDQDGGLVVPWLIPLIEVVERWAHRRDLRAASRDSLFPLAPRMFIGLTPARLLIWRMRRRSRLGPFLGFVTLDRIVQAEAPTIGQGWRTLRVHLANEPTVNLKVPGSLADDLASALSGSVEQTDL